MYKYHLAKTDAHYICPLCSTRLEKEELDASSYLCLTCGLELAHIDRTETGALRGIFGYLLSSGEILNSRYRITSLIGKGGFGATYLVDDLKVSGKSRALKEIPELLYDEEEASILGQLHHPSIPDLLDRFQERGMVYLVLEFGGHRTLGGECKRTEGRLPIPKVRSFMHQLCEALEYLHSQDPPVIHRDLKPDNVLLDDNERIMLIDFGVAKRTKATHATRVIARAATHHFSPPEQVHGLGTDERSDIYSMGATLYQLLTGQPPRSVLERLNGADLEPPSVLVQGIPKDIEAAVMRCLNLNPDKRPSGISDLTLMMRNIESRETPTLKLPPSRNATFPGKRPRQNPRTLILIVLLTAAGAFCIWMATRTEAPVPSRPEVRTDSPPPSAPPGQPEAMSQNKSPISGPDSRMGSPSAESPPAPELRVPTRAGGDRRLPTSPLKGSRTYTKPPPDP